MREEAEASAQEEHDCKIQEEVKWLIDEKLARAAKRDRWLEEKLTAVLEGQLSQEAEEMGDAEESKAVGTEEVGTTGGTQSSAMEMDEEGEDEVVVVEEVKRGETRKRAPSLPPKSSRKRVRAGMATQTPAGSQVKGGSVPGSQVGMGTVGSTGGSCWRCVKHRVQCIMLSSGA